MRAILLALLLATQLTAQTVKTPAEAKLDPATGLPVRVVIEWDGDDVQFTDKLSDDVFVFREHSTDPKKISLVLMVVRNAKEGTYYLNAVACKDKKLSPFATTKIVVGKGAPKPPDPTDPPVDPPTPTDAYFKAAQDAYTADTSPTKSSEKSLLLELYRNAPAMLEKRADVKTAAQLKSWFQGSRKAVIGEGLAGVRKVLNAAMDEVTKDPSAAIDDALKVKVKAAFMKMATALEATK